MPRSWKIKYPLRKQSTIKKTYEKAKLSFKKIFFRSLVTILKQFSSHATLFGMFCGTNDQKNSDSLYFYIIRKLLLS